MLGFHRRIRSLIPVKDLAKYEKLAAVVGEEEQQDVDCESVETNHTQLTWIYVIFLAEACVFHSRNLLPRCYTDVSLQNYGLESPAAAQDAHLQQRLLW